MKQKKLKKIYVSEAGCLLIKTKEFKDGKVCGDEITGIGVEKVEWNVEEENDEDTMVLIGKTIPVYGVVDKDNDILTEQLPFYFQRDFAVSAAKQMNDSVTEKKKPYKVKKAYLLYLN